jgi:hypothetical protein
MIYYDRPTLLQEGTEETIISTVHELLPNRFLAIPSKGAARAEATLGIPQAK